MLFGWWLIPICIGISPLISQQETDMKTFKKTFAAGLATLATLAIGAGLVTQADARDIEAGTVLMCETQVQAERLAVLLHGDAENAVSSISAINAEEDSGNGCGVADIVYLLGTDVATVRGTGDTFQIAPVLVMGILQGNNIQSVPQSVYFSVIKIDERRA
jgi:hypothetical protein